MQRSIEIRFNDKESSFQVTRIERSKLYGSKRRIPIDAHGKECIRASLTSDGSLILPQGSTAMLYLDKQGEVVDRNKLQTIDSGGKAVKLRDSDEILEIREAAQAMDLLDFSISHAYNLDPVFLTSDLSDSLSLGAIYFLPDFHSAENRQAFLLGNNHGYFILVGQKTGFDFSGLAEADLSMPEMESDFNDEEDANLDFSMFKMKK